MNSQLDIFATLDAPAARTIDPITSHEAAVSAKELQAHHSALIVECLKRYGPGGKDFIAARTRLEAVQVCRRLVELQRAKLIRLTGRKVPSTAGRAEREWCLADEYPKDEPRHVLKADGASRDATDRGISSMRSPGVGPMGAGQAADAASTGDRA